MSSTDRPVFAVNYLTCHDPEEVLATLKQQLDAAKVLWPEALNGCEISRPPPVPTVSRSDPVYAHPLFKGIPSSDKTSFE